MALKIGSVATAKSAGREAHPATPVAGVLPYSGRDANYLKRFTFGGHILDKDYFCVPEGGKSKVLFFAPGTPATN